MNECNYKETSTNLNNNNTAMSTAIGDAKALNYNGVWSGTSHNTLTTALNDTLTKADKALQDLENFSAAMDLLDQYKANKEKIEKLTAERDSISVPDAEKFPAEAAAAAARINELNAQITELTEKNKSLRVDIEARLSLFTEISVSLDLIVYDVKNTQQYMDFVFDIYELKAKYDNRWGDKDGITGDPLTKLGDKSSLFNLYNELDENGNPIKGTGKAYIEGIITQIQNEYSGREAAVNCALAMLQLAADKGVKIDYHAHGTDADPYTSTADVALGVDCNPFTGWVVDKGTPGGFQWRPVGNFKSVGETLEDWTQAQPGDVFVVSNGSSNHVGVIIENNPETKEFICAEAKGQDVGIVLNTRTYQNLDSGGYQIRDMTNVYNGTENTNRECFEATINKEGFERAV